MNKIVPVSSSDSRSSNQSNYKKTILPNGIRIVTEEIPYVRSVSIGVWINVGSRDENERNNGISHFVEHMVFKGTKRFNTQQIARSLESVGGYLNAFTSKEHTCFYARTLDEYLPKAVDVLSDLVQHPLYNKADMEKEKFVVLEELKNIEDDPDDLIHDYFDRSVYQKHPLGYPVIGKAENIKNFSNNDLFEYSRKHYHPNRMVVAGAGNLKHEEVVELVEKHFRSVKSKKKEAKRAHVSKHSNAKREVFERPISQAHVCLGTMGYGVKSKQRYPLLVLNTLLGEGMSSRLFQNIREKYGFAYSVYSFANLLSDTGSFGVYIGTDNNNIENSIELIHKELDKLRTKPVGSAEIKRTKSQLKGTIMLSLESMSSRMMRLGSSEIYLGEQVPHDEILRKIDAVNADDIFETANNLFRMEDFSTIIFKPTATKAATA